MSTVKYRVSFNKKPSQKPHKNPAQPSRAARQLALAYYIERLIESGDIKNYSEAAQKIGVTRTRMTQIRNLLNLSPRIQETILLGESRISERQLRGITDIPDWNRQEI